jgi:type IV secretion system protein VirD4
MLISIVFLAKAVSESWPTSAVVVGILFLAVVMKRGYRRLTTLGSARWAEESDLRRAGMVGASSGLILGRLPVSRQPRLQRAIPFLFQRGISAKEACRQFNRTLWSKKEELIRLPNAIHTAVFSPSGGGKGVSCVVPFLKMCDEPCVVVDFKGENALLTAAHRQKYFGHRIVLLDPYKVITPTADTFNPLDFISKDDPLAIDQCNELAKALVVRTGEEKEPHWNDSAEAWIAALIAMLVQFGDAGEGTRSLQTAREILSNPQKLELAIKVMLESNAWGGILARMGGNLLHFIDREKSSTLSTAARHLRFLDSLAIMESVGKSSFDPAQLRTGKMTIYLILPPNQMQTQSPLLRLWITSLFRAVVAGGLQERNKVHYVLDEAASLGSLEAINDAVDKYRGYGIRLILLYQSMGQLKKCFPNGQDQTLLSNTTQVFFGVNDQAIGTGGTADYVSARLGEKTIIVESGGKSTSNSHSYSSGQHGSRSTSTSYTSNDNWQQQTRRLLKPEEVVALPPRTAITFTPGVPPIRTNLLRYYEEPRLGVRPGRLGRIAGACGTLAASTLMAIWFVFIAFSLMAFVHDQARQMPPSMQIKNRQPDVPAGQHRFQ